MAHTQYVADVFTGIRPTGGLTVANFLGAVHPIINFQKQGRKPLVFVADLHALTDNEPDVVRQHARGVVADYLALGINPEITKIFMQSHIRKEIAFLTMMLARLISVAELVRVPTLKDKIAAGSSAESANALLMLYPVMMAADILIQRAHYIPVGEDQVAHLEITRKLARRFNQQYGDIFPIPQVEVLKTLRILSLKGEGKMSKSHPEGALFLTDDAATVAQKVRRAQTAFAGQMSPQLESHILIANMLGDEHVRDQVGVLIGAHMDGEGAMGSFKELLTEVVQDFLGEFQERRRSVMADPSYIDDIIADGNEAARGNAVATLELVESALF